jgi:hypothetical protein
MSFFSTDSEGITEEIHIDADEAEIRAAANQIARALRVALSGAFKGFEKELGDILSGVMRGQAARDVTAGIRDIGNQTRVTSEEVEELTEDLRALAQRSEAFKSSLSSQGQDTRLFAVFDTQVRRLLELEKEFKDKRVQLANDPELLEARRAEARNIIRVLQAEQVSVGRIIDAGRSANVASQQQETTLRNAEIRTQGALAVAQEQRTARARIEIFRFVTRQAIFFERQIAQAFRGTVRILGRTINSIQAGLARTASLFQRSNREINDGLNGALIAREGAMARSFTRQTALVQTQVTRQQAILQRFQAQASTGLAGVATGRSQLGALVGGGFLLIDKLRAGFEESVNLNESMNKTRQIFQDATEDIVNFTSTSAESLFVTQSAALEAAANFGIFGRAAGLTGDELSDFSITLVNLATDLASFNNTSVQEATTAISAALRGESEPIRKFGVLLNEVVLQNRALELGIIDTKRTLQPFERVLAANAEILAQTSVAQGDAARTANDFANSSRRAKAASIETFAAIAAFLVPFATFLTNLAFPTLQGITKFINNEVSPALQILRDGLIGAAIALGGLLAAKAAGEALQFLAFALRLVVTPLGLFITLAAGLGAAINILSKRSPAVRAAIERITDALGTAFSTALEFAVRLLDSLANTLTNVVLPLLEQFARFLVNNLDRAIRTAFEFITDTAIPAIQRFAGFIRDELIPPLITLADILVDRVQQGLVFVKDAAVDLFRAVQPFIQPALDGFAQLGGAIRDAFAGGDFGGILGGLEAVGTGIVQSFSNVGNRIADLLFPQLVRVANFVKDFFQGNTSASKAVENALLGPFQRAVEALGFFLGNVITDPRLLRALEAIIGLAVLTGVNFVKGFVRGVSDNLDENFSQFGGQFLDALEFSLKKALANPATLAKIIAAGLVGSQILRAYDTASRKGAARFAKGFGAGIASSVRATPQFLTGFFGGAGALERVAGQEADRAHARMISTFQGINRDLARLGRPEIVASIIDEDAIRRGNAALETARTELGEVGTAARIAREHVRESFSGMRDIAGGFIRTLRDPNLTGLQSFQQGIGKISTAFRDSFNDMTAQAGTRGAAIGNILASSIMSATGAVLSGKLAGESSGLGRGLGLAGIFASAALPVALNPGPIGLAIGGLSAVLGGLAFAFGATGKAAEEQAARVDTFTEALLRNKDAASQVEATSDILVDGFKDLGDGARDALIRGGINFDTIAADLQAGGESVDKIFANLARRLGFSEAAISGITSTIGTDLGDLGDQLRFVPETTGGLATSESIRALQDFNREAEALGFNVSDIASGFRFLDPNIDAFIDAQGIAGDVTKTTNDETKEQLDVLKASRNQMNDYVNGLKERASATAVAAQETRLDNVAIEENARIAEERARGIQSAVDELNRQRTSGIQTEINQVAERLGAAREASDLAREALKQFLQGDYGDAAEAAIGDLILSVPGLASSLQESFSLTPQLQFASQNKTFKELGSGAFAALEQEFNKGTLITTEDARRVLAPFFATIEELRNIPIEPVLDPDGKVIQEGGGISKEVADLMTGELNKLLDDENFQVLLDTIKTADDTQAQLQTQLDQLELDLGVKVFFDEDQIKAAFKAITGFDLTLPLSSGLLGQGVIPSLVSGQQAGVITTTQPNGTQLPVNIGGAGAGGIVIDHPIINVNGAQSPPATAAELQRRARVAAQGALNVFN